MLDMSDKNLMNVFLKIGNFIEFMTKDELNSMRVLTSYVVVNENVQNPQLLHAVKLFLQLMFKYFLLQ